MKNYPIGIQSFRKIRENDFLYVDKTALIYDIVTKASHYFISRPRRFGKSLLISTLIELFKGNQALFEGLWIENKIEWIKYPIIHFDFGRADFKDIGLEAAILDRINSIASAYELILTKAGFANRFDELIKRLAAQGKPVVVLVDEYDKPIIDYLDQPEQAKANRDLLKAFYSILKPADDYLRFVFLTGVSKFSQVSIFSDLNNLNDLTLDPNYVNLLGYTQEELEHYFDSEIQQGAGRVTHLQDIKEWYNGYSWDGEHFVYNPFSVLNYFSKKVFQNFWFSTGTPTFLVKQIRQEFEYNWENLKVSMHAFDNFQLENVSPETLLFQTGYLTIKAVDKDQLYTLSYPNKEVKQSLLNYLLADLSVTHVSRVAPSVVQLRNALQAHNLDQFVDVINSLFAAIPYQLFLAKKEAYYHSIIFLTLHLLGYYTEAEVSTNKGRLDAVIHTSTAIYVLEFKLNQSAEIALEQIRERDYAARYQLSGQDIFLVGINFDAETRKINEYQLVKN